MSLDFSLEMKLDTGGEPYTAQLFWANYTHNVTPMWRKAGVYDALYNSNGLKAADIIEALDKGYRHMLHHREQYLMLNPENGWGDYGSAMDFLHNVAVSCKHYPNATVSISK